MGFGGGAPGEGRRHDAPDTVRIAAFRVDFLKDSADYETTGDGRFDMREADSAKVPVDPPPHNRLYFEKQLEALRRYYEIQTNGALFLDFSVFPQEPDSAYHLPDTKRYGPWLITASSDSINARAERFIRESLRAADGSDDPIDWKQYQSFMIFHAGADLQGDANGDTDFDIPSFNLYLSDSLAVTVGGADSVTINFVMVVPETVSQDGYMGVLNGTLAHEFAHQLGFFDLYNVATGLPAVGVFSLMDSGEGLFGQVPNKYEDGEPVFVRGILPASLDPWHRLLFFPWAIRVTEAAPEETLSTELPGVLIENDVLHIPVHLDEYFLVENRPIDYNRDGTVVLKADSLSGVIMGPVSADSAGTDLGRFDYDYLLPGGGVLIWHIDERAAVEGLINYGGVNVFDDRRGVDLEEADQIQDIGTASSEFTGGPLDPYFVGGYDRFGPDTVPNSRSNDGTETGISVSVVDSAKTVMRVLVGDPKELAGWPLFLRAPDTAREALNLVDINRDGNDDLVFAADTSLYGLSADSPESPEGGFVLRLAAFLDTLRQGPSVVTRWPAVPPRLGSIMMAHAGGQARWFTGDGRLIGYWRGTATTRVTAGPTVFGEHLVVGCSDGTARVLKQGLFGMGADLLFTVQAPGVVDSILSLAAGRTAPGEPLWIAAGTKDGKVLVAVAAVPEDPPVVQPGWPIETEYGRITGLLVLHAPLRVDTTGRNLLLVASDGGWCDLRDLDSGASIPGWPHIIDGPPAGTPAVGDLDGDGILEVLVVTRSGEIDLWDLSGPAEPHWPKSLWHPDASRRTPTTTSPVIWDLAGDGRPEIVQVRGDGIVMALDVQGNPIAGWPYASGFPGSGGPLRLTAPDGGERWYFTHAYNDSVTAVSAIPLPGWLAVVEDCIGCFPAPGAGPGRSFVYPDSLVPVPIAVGGFLDPSRVLFLPNPVRGDALTIRYVLGSPGAMEAMAFDLSGRIQAKAQWDGLAGPQGDTFRWDLSGLASGVYLVRLKGTAEGRTVTIKRMVAVVR